MTEKLGLRVEEAAELAGVCLATMFRRMRRGEVRSILVNNRRLIVAEDVPTSTARAEHLAMQKFLDGQAAEPLSAEPLSAEK